MKAKSINWIVPGLDGKPARVRLTGFNGSSVNHKTGAMTQSWITPLTWSEDYVDVSQSETVCGNCPLISKCYVKNGLPKQGLISTSKSQVNEKQHKTMTDIAEHLNLFNDQAFRFGSFGEPVLMGEKVVKTIADNVPNWTGYTHQWKEARFQWAKRYFMASCETVEQVAEAESMGWRAYYVRPVGSEAPANMVQCPYYTKGIQCDRCGLCKGASIGAKSVTVEEHK